ncbi:MAG: hypothetical protein R3A79_13040 [Nannocystaceae bacterium]
MPARAVSAALRGLLPTADAAEAEHAAAFRATAELLLGGCTLRIAGERYRLTELEFYWTSARHPDPFTHGDPLQREFGRWYFHRQGGTYKGGTYKGLDIAVGAPERAAGILLRGVAAPCGERIDGSCAVVERILERTGAASVAALADSFDRAIDRPAGEGRSPLALELDAEGTAAPRVIYASPRVGLTLKRGADALRRRYLARPYRLLVEPETLTKGRLHVALGLYAEGVTAPEIAARTGVRRAHVDRYIAAFERGRGRDPAAYQRSLTTAELCELFGALA